MSHEGNHAGIGCAKHGERAIEVHGAADGIAGWPNEAGFQVGDQVVVDVAAKGVEVCGLDGPGVAFEMGFGSGRRQDVAEVQDLLG